jgi:hypothetical protein
VDTNGHDVEFVGGGCEGLGMEEIELEEIRVHTAQARWIAERLERMNEAFATLSGTFMGFLGIELAFLGQIDKFQITKNWITTISAWVTVGSMILAIVCFVAALQSTSFRMPDLKMLKRSWRLPEESRIMEPLRMMLDTDDNENIIKSLEDENAILGRWYTPGVYLGLLGQLGLAVLLFAKWA